MTMNTFKMRASLEMVNDLKDGKLNAVRLNGRKVKLSSLNGLKSLIVEADDDNWVEFDVTAISSAMEDGIRDPILLLGNRCDQFVRDELIIASIYNLLFLNDLTCGAWIDVLGDLKVKESLYAKNKKAKILVKELGVDFRKYERMINDVIGFDRADFYSSANQHIEDAVKGDLKIFYHSCKQVLDNHKIEESALYAKLIVVRSMADYSACCHKRHLAAINERYPGKGKQLNYLSMYMISEKLNCLVRELSKKQDDNIDLNEEKNVVLAFKILTDKLSDCNIIADAIMKRTEEPTLIEND